MDKLWDLERDKVINEIIKRNAKNILFQFPDGLITHVKREINAIKKELNQRNYDNFNLTVWGGTNFGACDLCDSSAEKMEIDLIIHYGHEKLPYVHPKIPTIFIPAYYITDEDKKNNLFENVDRYISEKEGDVSIVTTVQYKNILKKYNPSIILGCRGEIKNLKNNILYIGTGRFHPLFLSYKYRKKVDIFNPSTLKFSKITKEEIDKFIKQRLGILSKYLLMDLDSAGVVISTKPGQCRKKLFNRVIDLMRSNGIKPIPIVMDNISPERLLQYNLVMYVICACPRIVLDDGSLYQYKVITPKEFEMILNKDFNYKFDEVSPNDF